MNVEMVWLAYDERLLKRAWREISLRELYMELLQDDYRRRVDPRSMLFHKSQFFLLQDLELLMKQGGMHLTLEEYLARLFHKGIEQFPTETGELMFDYRLVSYFTSLRMADDYSFVETFLQSLLTRVGKLPAGQRFSLLEISNVDALFNDLETVSVADIMQAAQAEGKSPEMVKACVKLITNYIEFYHYMHNNHLSIFSYNNQTDPKRWGNLLARKAERDKRVVELTYKGKAREVTGLGPKPPKLMVEDDLVSKMRFKRKLENLELGLQDFDPLIRQKAAEGLGMVGNYASVQPLLKVLHDEVSEVRQEVVRALGIIRDPRTAADIIDLMLKDDSVAVIRTGAQALLTLGEPRGLEALVELLLRGVYDVAVQITYFPGLAKQRTAINMLLQAVQHPNELVRRQVTFILGDVPLKASVDLLIAALADPDGEVQANAASSLGRLKAKRALPDLYQVRNRLENVKQRFVVEEAIDAILN